MGTLTQNLERQRGKCHRQGRTSDGHTFIIYYVLCIYYDGHYFMSWERGSDRMGGPFLVISLWLCDMTEIEYSVNGSVLTLALLKLLASSSHKVRAWILLTVD